MPETLTCVRIGDGYVASLHERKLRDIGIETVGLIDPDTVKQKEALKKGMYF